MFRALLTGADPATSPGRVRCATMVPMSVSASSIDFDSLSRAEATVVQGVTLMMDEGKSAEQVRDLVYRVMNDWATARDALAAATGDEPATAAWSDGPDDIWRVAA